MRARGPLVRGGTSRSLPQAGRAGANVECATVVRWLPSVSHGGLERGRLGQPLDGRGRERLLVERRVRQRRLVEFRHVVQRRLGLHRDSRRHALQRQLRLSRFDDQRQWRGALPGAEGLPPSLRTGVWLRKLSACALRARVDGRNVYDVPAVPRGASRHSRVSRRGVRELGWRGHPDRHDATIGVRSQRHGGATRARNVAPSRAIHERRGNRGSLRARRPPLVARSPVRSTRHVGCSAPTHALPNQGSSAFTTPPSHCSGRRGARERCGLRRLGRFSRCGRLRLDQPAAQPAVLELVDGVDLVDGEHVQRLLQRVPDGGCRQRRGSARRGRCEA